MSSDDVYFKVFPNFDCDHGANYIMPAYLLKLHTDYTDYTFSARNISSPVLAPRRRLNSSLKSSRSDNRSMCRRISPILSDLLPSFDRIPGVDIDTLCIVLLRKPDFERSVLPVNVCCDVDCVNCS